MFEGKAIFLITSHAWHTYSFTTSLITTLPRIPNDVCDIVYIAKNTCTCAKWTTLTSRRVLILIIVSHHQNRYMMQLKRQTSPRGKVLHYVHIYADTGNQSGGIYYFVRQSILIAKCYSNCICTVECAHESSVSWIALHLCGISNMLACQK